MSKLYLLFAYFLKILTFYFRHTLPVEVLFETTGSTVEKGMKIKNYTDTDYFIPSGEKEQKYQIINLRISIL